MSETKRVPSHRFQIGARFGALVAGLQLALLLLCMGGCSTPPRVPVSGPDLLVRYRAAANPDQSPGVQLVLIHENHSQYDQLFSANKGKGSVKRVTAVDFDALVSDLNREGFFEMATVVPDPLAAGRPEIVLETPFQQWIVAKTPSYTIEDHRRFNSMFEVLRTCHDKSWTLQVEESEDGGDLFRKQKDRFERERIQRQQR